MGPHNELQINADNSGLGKTLLPQLCQLLSATWDGGIIAKADRDELIKKGLAVRGCGYTVITVEGLDLLTKLNILRP